MLINNAGALLVVNVTSIAGRMVFPFFGAYCASKWALDALSESMRYELSSQGVDVAIVEPGFFHTQLFARAQPLQRTAPGERPLRTCVGVDMGVRALNDATKDIGLNLLTALGLPHLLDVRTAAAAPA